MFYLEDEQNDISDLIDAQSDISDLSDEQADISDLSDVQADISDIDLGLGAAPANESLGSSLFNKTNQLASSLVNKTNQLASSLGKQIDIGLLKIAEKALLILDENVIQGEELVASKQRAALERVRQIFTGDQEQISTAIDAFNRNAEEVLQQALYASFKPLVSLTSNLKSLKIRLDTLFQKPHVERFQSGLLDMEDLSSEEKKDVENYTLLLNEMKKQSRRMPIVILITSVTLLRSQTWKQLLHVFNLISVAFDSYLHPKKIKEKAVKTILFSKSLAEANSSILEELGPENYFTQKVALNLEKLNLKQIELDLKISKQNDETAKIYDPNSPIFSIIKTLTKQFLSSTLDPLIAPIKKYLLDKSKLQVLSDEIKVYSNKAVHDIVHNNDSIAKNKCEALLKQLENEGFKDPIPDRLKTGASNLNKLSLKKALEKCGETDYKNIPNEVIVGIMLNDEKFQTLNKNVLEADNALSLFGTIFETIKKLALMPFSILYGIVQSGIKLAFIVKYKIEHQKTSKSLDQIWNQIQNAPSEKDIKLQDTKSAIDEDKNIGSHEPDQVRSSLQGEIVKDIKKVYSEIWDNAKFNPILAKMLAINKPFFGEQDDKILTQKALEKFELKMKEYKKQMLSLSRNFWKSEDRQDPALNNFQTKFEEIKKSMNEAKQELHIVFMKDLMPDIAASISKVAESMAGVVEKVKGPFDLIDQAQKLVIKPEPGKVKKPEPLAMNISKAFGNYAISF